jgi:ribosomal protein S18 acetylase RimI-like enzyme
MPISSIRNANINDAERIATIHVKTWQCAYNGHIPDTYLDKLSIQEKTASWQKNLKNPLPDMYAFVIEQAGQVVGWCTAGKSLDKDLSNLGQIFGIYIDSDHLGEGLGTKLLNYGLSFLKEKGYKKALLWVLTSNDNSRRFYEKNGWEIEGKTKIEHHDGLELPVTRYITEIN